MLYLLSGRREGNFCRNGKEGKANGDLLISLLVVFLDGYDQGISIFCVSVSDDVVLRVVFISSSRSCGSKGFMSGVSQRRSCMLFRFVLFVLGSGDIVFVLGDSSVIVPS